MLSSSVSVSASTKAGAAMERAKRSKRQSRKAKASLMTNLILLGLLPSKLRIVAHISTCLPSKRLWKSMMRLKVRRKATCTRKECLWRPVANSSTSWQAVTLPKRKWMRSYLTMATRLVCLMRAISSILWARWLIWRAKKEQSTCLWEVSARLKRSSKRGDLRLGSSWIRSQLCILLIASVSQVFLVIRLKGMTSKWARLMIS